MKEYIVCRIYDIADSIINDGLTVRQAGIKHNVSKSTVHSDMTVRLPMLDKSLYDEVKKVLNFNFSMRHLRGGESTRKKYISE